MRRIPFTGGGGTFYGREQFSPLLIILMIVCLQLFFYLSLSFSLFITDQATALEDSVFDQMFLYSKINFETVPGWTTTSVHVITALGPYMVALVLFVRRAKKCLDFIVTNYVVHLLACTAYGGFPKSWSWWFVTTLTAAVLAVSAEFICLKYFELQEISLGTSTARGSGATAATAGSSTIGNEGESKLDGSSLKGAKMAAVQADARAKASLSAGQGSDEV
ncbi:Protein SYS1-like [Porphyridium purpureum]|uniref:Protein SYS1-like n=1 Tax=Porphyridium purpureum TaxID=35688 RepID=A0A5J4YYC7_PORPP|nr:Protein SYS1-like [Porphyridium purpureum]|eukprot:POR2965..scf208_2